MALIKSGNIGGSARGGVDYELYCDQTGGSGNRRDVDVCLRLRLAGNRDWNYASSFGYAAQWQAVAHNVTTGWGHVKGTEFWYSAEGWREFHHRFGIDVGTTNSVNITVGFNLDSLIDNQWDAQVRGTFTVGSTNQAPTMSGTISTFYRIGDNGSWNLITREGVGTENSIKIPETATHIRCDWLAGNDDKGESNLTYKLWNQQNDGAWSIIYQGNAKSYTHTINAGNEGRSYDYYVTATDRDGATSSPNIDTLQFIKNVFTGASITSISNIAYNSTYVDISWNNPSNTDGTENFIFALTCDGITIYNNETKSTSRSMRVHIATSARTDGAAYILKNDLINKFSNSSYKGTLNFTLTSTNAYGTKKTNSKGGSVNLQSTPGAVPSCSLDLANSTAYVTLASNNSKYIIPDGSKNVKLVWTKATGGIGEAITYDIYVAYGSGTWTLIKSDIPQNTLSYLHVIPKQSASVSVKYRITSKTSYGFSSSRDTSSYTLHYYNTPSLVVGAMNRTASSATLKVNINVNTSLSNAIAISGTWACYNKGTTTNPVSQGNLATNIGEQTINISNLKEMDQYDLKITYKDNSGFSSNVTHPTISIGQTKSVFFVNKYGIGVNGLKADANFSLQLQGAININNIGQDKDLLRLGTDRAWKFTQGGSAGNTSLDLVSEVDSKTFRVINASKTKAVHMYVDANSAKLTVNGDAVCSTLVVNGGGTGTNPRMSYHTTQKCTYISNLNNNWLKLYDDGRLTWKEKPIEVLTTINNSDFYGLSNGNGTENGWLRVPTSGLIPNMPNGSNNNGGSNLGTSTWRFSTIYATYLNLNSGIDASGVVKTADSFNINDKAKWGVGGNDTYIYNAVSGKYLQFKNNGMLYISDVLIGDPRFKIGGVSNAWWNSVITIASDGVSEVGRYLDFHQGSNNTSDYNCRLETNSGNLICSGSIQQNSDAYLKENIVYIDEIIEDLVEEEPQRPVTYSSRETAINYEMIHPFKDFIRNSLRTATFNYKRSSNNTFGFIAQDINEHKIGQLFIKEYEKEIIDKSLSLDENRVIGTKKTLAFDLNAFSTVIAKALQEEIISRDIEIEKLEARIAKLENKDMETINNE